MSFSTRMGRLFGIDIYLHWSFVLVPLFVLYSSWTLGRGLTTTGLSLLLTLALFGCVLLHELGHALMARRFGIQTRDIVMLPIGGLARLERMPRKPIQEFLIAIAGPAVNVAIAGILLISMAPFMSMRDLLTPGLAGSSFFVSLMLANVILVLFNLLPAFPMDGGRVLRSLCAMIMPYEDATIIAGRIGQGMAILFAVVGFLWQPTMLLIAVFVFFAAQTEIRMVRYGQSVRPLPNAYRRNAFQTNAYQVPAQRVDDIDPEIQFGEPQEYTRSIRLPNGATLLVRDIQIRSR